MTRFTGGRGKGADKFLTVIYQIDSDCRRLLWVGRKRTQASLRRGLEALGPEVVGGLKFVCSDMWQPYLKVIAAKAGQALHVLDRFHICGHLNQAVDQVRRAESVRLRGNPLAKRLKKMRWHLLKRRSRVRGRARIKLNALLASKLATARAWDLKESFAHFWRYKIGRLGAGVLVLLVHPRAAQPPGADAQSGAHAPGPRAVDSQLVPRQGRDLQRGRRGLKQQDSSGDQTLVWLSHLRRDGNSPLSRARPASRARVNPQILLTRQQSQRVALGGQAT